jgi:hypothetical protein
MSATIHKINIRQKKENSTMYKIIGISLAAIMLFIVFVGVANQKKFNETLTKGDWFLVAALTSQAVFNFYAVFV